jgi:predicted metal-dependent peptidase
MPAPLPNPTVEEMKPSEAIKLKAAFEHIIVNDPRCIGLARYIANVRIFWSHEIPTACAGHGFIFFNPTFYDSIPEQSRITVCVHEIWHLILKHLERSKGFDPYIYNQAADHVINNALEEDGFTFEGTEPCKDPQYKHQSSEQIYNTIYEEQKKNNKPAPGSMDGHIPAEKIEDLIEEIVNGEGQTLDDQKKKAEADVDKFGKQAGSDTSSNGIRLDLTNKKVMIIGATYQDIFKSYLTDPLSGGKRTFMRPNRRQHGKTSKLVLPGRSQKKGAKNRLTHLIYAFDVSGSMVQYAQQCHDSIRTLKETLNPEKMTILFFDTQIKEEKTFTDKQVYGEIQVYAGGGTNLKGVWKRTAELNAEALVIFTDLCVTIPPKPDWDCIWLVPKSNMPVPDTIHGDVYHIPQN